MSIQINGNILSKATPVMLFNSLGQSIDTLTVVSGTGVVGPNSSYLSGVAIFANTNGNILASPNNLYASSQGDLYVNSLNAATGNLDINTPLGTLGLVAETLQIASDNFLPASTGINIGSVASPFNNLYINGIYGDALNIAGNGNIGLFNTVISEGSNGIISLGIDNTVQGTAAIAIGYGNTASGLISIAIGQANKSYGQNALAIGASTQSLGDASFSQGQDTIASGAQSFCGGINSQSLADDSFVYGINCVTTSAAQGAVVIGNAATGTTAGAWVFTDSSTKGITNSLGNSLLMSFSNGLVLSSGTPLIMTSANGTLWQINISNSGTFIITEG